MSIKIKNIKISDDGFDFKELGKYKVDKKLLPNKPREQMTFQLETNAPLANAIRRCLIDELPTYGLTFDNKDFSSDDMALAFDFIMSNLNNLPIYQHDYKGYTFELDVHNNHHKIRDIMTSDIQIKKNGKEIKCLDVFTSEHISIGTLNPFKKVIIKNIYVVQKINKEDGAFGLIPNPEYKILDQTPFEYTKEYKKGDMSINYNPKQFMFGIRTNRNISTKEVMILCCETLIKRMTSMINVLDEHIKFQKESNDAYFSELLNVEKDGQLNIYTFIGESYTLIVPLAHYAYLLDPSISLVSYGTNHLSSDEGYVSIIHAQPTKLLFDAGKKILSELINLKTYF